MTPAIRSARPDDYPEFLRLFPELGVPEPPPTAEHFAERLVPRALFATEAGEVAGYASWQVYGRAAHVVHVIVDRRHRRCGIGRALMDALRTRAGGAGCTRWYLNVKRDNEAARRLYERCGLRVDCEGWAVEMDWSCADNLLDDSAEAVAFTPDVQQELAACAQFGLEPERLARRRASGHIVPCALREGDSIAGFASFDPASPGAYPFCVARPGSHGRCWPR